MHLSKTIVGSRILNFTFVSSVGFKFFVKNAVIYHTKVDGTKFSTGARGSKFSQQVNNMLYFILEQKTKIDYFVSNNCLL